MTWREYREKSGDKFGVFLRVGKEEGSNLPSTEKMEDYRKGQVRRRQRTLRRQRARLRKSGALPAESDRPADGYEEHAAQLGKLSDEFATQIRVHPRYKLARTEQQVKEAFSSALPSNDDPTPSTDLRIKEGKKDDPQELAFRVQTMRSSKLGIEFGQENGRQVLFELGGLDESAAPKREPGDGRKDSKKNMLRSVTNVELRKAFRHDKGDKSLRFFRDGGAVAAPWVREKLWFDYLEKRAKKHNVDRPQYANKLPDEGKASRKTRKKRRRALRQWFRDRNEEINKAKEARFSGADAIGGEK
jgi:hypothetical protein